MFVHDTFDAGYLVPIFVDEALPGDTFNLRANLFGRLATPLKPIMTAMFLETFFFFVPNRLLWTNWPKFLGEQDNPGDSTDFTVPRVNGGAFSYANETLYDYMGIPTEITNVGFNSLHLRAYNLCVKEWFRDENLQASPVINTGDGPDANGNYALLRRGKRHDYFTSCLPWPQKGDPVNISLGGKAFITSDSNTADANLDVYDSDGVARLASVDVTNLELGGTGSAADVMYADLGAATGFTINDLRQSFQIQKLLERDARGGTRHTEIIRSHFGVTSPDARLQRPEFLGGGSQMININPVAQTSDQLSGGPGAESPQGNLAAFGTVNAQGHGFTKSFTEHGVILGLVNVRAICSISKGSTECGPDRAATTSSGPPWQ